MTRFAWGLLVWSLLAPALRAQSFWPFLSAPKPVAVQVGTQSDCAYTVMYGAVGAYQVVVSGSGVVGEVVKPVARTTSAAATPVSRAEAKIDVRFKVAADAPVGIRDVRLITPNGPTTLGHIVVVRDPVVRKTGTISTMKQAQDILVPATVCGAIGSEADFYKFKVEAGAALTFHVVCQRLLNKLSMATTYSAPIIFLRNSAGTILASNDYFFGGDPLLHHRFAKGGEYFLEIRDVRYERPSPYWEYAIEIHGRPFVTNIVPASLEPGVPTPVRLIGYNLPPDPTVTVTLPTGTHPWEQWLPLPSLAGQPLNSAMVKASNSPVVFHRPGDSRKSADIKFPSTCAGVLQREGDVDSYAFLARKGERFSFVISARLLNSPLDSVLRILDAKGETMIENDDASDSTGHRENRNEILCPDSRIENWEVPADGRYIVEVSDVHGRGGPRFAYALEARAAQPHFQLELTTDRTIVSPGGSGVIFVRSIRKEGFKGDIDLQVDGLPPGVSAECGSIPAACQDGCVLLRGTSVKPGAFGQIRVTGTATVAEPGKAARKLVALARPFGELTRDGGARYLVPADDHAVSVVDALDVRNIRISAPEITLKPGETKKVEVSIERRPGFTEPVTLSVASQMHVWVYGNCLPEGVTIDPSSQLRLIDNKLAGSIVFKAAPDAKAVTRHLVPLLGEVSINFSVRMYYPSEPFRVTVRR